LSVDRTSNSVRHGFNHDAACMQLECLFLCHSSRVKAGTMGSAVSK
jgi:hypothetical protein